MLNRTKQLCILTSFLLTIPLNACQESIPFSACNSEKETCPQPSDPPSPLFPIQVESVTTTPNSFKLTVNESKSFESITLIAKGSGRQDFNSDFSRFKFTSSNPNIATVTAQGNITGLKVGQTTIKVVYEKAEELAQLVKVEVQ